MKYWLVQNRIPSSIMIPNILGNITRYSFSYNHKILRHRYIHLSKVQRWHVTITPSEPTPFLPKETSGLCFSKYSLTISKPAAVLKIETIRILVIQPGNWKTNHSTLRSFNAMETMALYPPDLYDVPGLGGWKVGRKEKWSMYGWMDACMQVGRW